VHRITLLRLDGEDKVLLTDVTANAERCERLVLRATVCATRRVCPTVLRVVLLRSQSKVKALRAVAALHLLGLRLRSLLVKPARATANRLYQIL
jgi:hypothetical protein